MSTVFKQIATDPEWEAILAELVANNASDEEIQNRKEEYDAEKAAAAEADEVPVEGGEIDPAEIVETQDEVRTPGVFTPTDEEAKVEEDIVEEDTGEEDAGEEVEEDTGEEIKVVDPVTTDEVDDIKPVDQKGVDYDEIGESLGIFQELTDKKNAKQKEIEEAQEAGAPQETINALGDEYNDIVTQRLDLAESLNIPVEEVVTDEVEVAEYMGLTEQGVDVMPLGEFNIEGEQSTKDYLYDDPTKKLADNLASKHGEYKFTKNGEGKITMTHKESGDFVELNVGDDQFKAYEIYAALIADKETESKKPLLTAREEAEDQFEGMVSKYKPINLTVDEWLKGLAPVVEYEAKWPLVESITKRGGVTEEEDPIAFHRNRILYDLYTRSEGIKNSTISISDEKNPAEVLNDFYKLHANVFDALARDTGKTIKEVLDAFQDLPSAAGKTWESKLEYLKKSLQQWPDYDVRDYELYRYNQMSAAWMDNYADLMAPIEAKYNGQGGIHEKNAEEMTPEFMELLESKYSLEELNTYFNFSAKDINGVYITEEAQLIAAKMIAEYFAQFPDKDGDGIGDPWTRLNDLEANSELLELQGDIHNAVLEAEGKHRESSPITKEWDNFFENHPLTIKANEAYVAEATSAYVGFSFDYDVTTSIIKSSYLDRISVELDNMDFMARPWAEKKLILSSILERDMSSILANCPDPSTVKDVEAEFWAYFYDQEGLGRGDGRVGNTLFAHKDVAENILQSAPREVDKLMQRMLDIFQTTPWSFKQKGKPAENLKWEDIKDYPDLVAQVTGVWRMLGDNDFDRVELMHLSDMVSNYEIAIKLAEEIIASSDPEYTNAIYNFFTGLFSGNITDYQPVLNGIFDSKDQAKIKRVIERVQAGVAAPDEIAFLNAVAIDQHHEALMLEKSKAMRIGNMVKESTPFILEMIVSSPLYSGIKIALGRKIGNWVLAKQGVNMAKVRWKGKTLTPMFVAADKARIARNTAWLIATPAALTGQSLTMQQNIIAHQLEFMTPEFAWSFSSEADKILDEMFGKPEFDSEGNKISWFDSEYGGGLKVIADGDGAGVAYGKGAALQFIEMMTERLGFHGAKLTSKALQKMGLEELERIAQRLTLAYWLRKRGGLGGSKFSDVLNKASLQSSFWEIMEEMPATQLSNIVIGNPVFQGQLEVDSEGNYVTNAWGLPVVDVDALTDMIGAVTLTTKTLHTGGAVFSPRLKGTDFDGTFYTVDQKKEFEKALRKAIREGRYRGVEFDFDTKEDIEWANKMNDIIEAAGLKPGKINSVFTPYVERVIAGNMEVLDELDDETSSIFLELLEAIQALEIELAAVRGNMNLTPKARYKQVKEIEAKIRELQTQMNLIPEVQIVRERITKQKAEDILAEEYDRVKAAIDEYNGDNPVDIQLAQNSDEVAGIILDYILTANGYTAVNESDGSWTGKVKNNETGEVSKLKPKEVEAVNKELNQILEGNKSGVYKTVGKNNVPLIVIDANASTTVTTDPKTGDTTVGDPFAPAHELTHHMVRKILRESPELAITLGNAVMTFLNSVDPNMVKDSGLAETLAAIQRKYKNGALVGEEALATFVSLLNKGYFQKNKSGLKKLGDKFKAMFIPLGVDVRLETPEDVYEWLVNFNETLDFSGAVEVGGIIERVREDVKIALDDAEEAKKEIVELVRKAAPESLILPDDDAIIDIITGQTKFSEDITDEEIQQSYDDSSVDSQTVQDIYAGKDTNPNWQYDIVQAYGGMIRKMFDSNLATAPSDDIENLLINNKEDIISDLEMEVLVLTTTFNPDNQKFGNIAAYINGLLNKRKFGIFDNYAGTERQGTTGLETDEGTVKPSVEGEVDIYDSEGNIFFLDENGLPVNVNIIDAVIIGENSEEAKDNIKESVNQSEVDYNTLLDAKDVQEVPMPRVVRDLMLSNTNPTPNKSSGVEFTGPLAPAFVSFCEAIVGKDNANDFARRLVSAQTLTNKQRNAIRSWITSSVDEETGEYNLLKLLPLHHTPNGDAVGVFETVLNAFYTDLGMRGATTDATEAGKVGMASKGLRLFEINEDLGKEDIDALLGINPDGTYAKGTSWDQLLKALVKQYAVEAIRQEIKIPAEGIVTDQVWSILSEGKGDIVFDEDITIDGAQIPQEDIQRVGAIDEPIINEHKGDKKKLSEVLTYWRAGFDELKKITNVADVESVKISIERIYANFPEIVELADELAARVVDAWKPIVAKIDEGKTRPTDRKLLNALLRGTDPSTNKAWVNSEQAAIVLAHDPAVVAKMKSIDITVSKNILEEAIKSGDPEAIEKALRMVISLKAHGTGSPSRIGYWRKYDENGEPLHSQGWYEGIFGEDLSAIDGLTFELTPTGKQIKVSSIKINGVPLSELLGRKVDIAGLSMKGSNMITETGDQKAKREARELEAIEALNIWVEHLSKKYLEQGNGIGTNELQVGIAALLDNMNTVLSQAARYKWNETGMLDLLNKVGPKEFNKSIEVEHMQPRVRVIFALFNEHINRDGLTTEEAADFLKNYEIAIISKEFNQALKDNGVQSSFAPDQTVSDPSWFRYYFKLHPNLRPIQNKDTGEILPVAEAVSKAVNALEVIGVDINNAESVELANQLLAEYFDAKDEEVNGASVFDFDDTLAFTDSRVLWTFKDKTTGEVTTGSLSAEEFASDFITLKSQGYEFDFSEFNKVVDGKPGPLLQKLRDRIDKYGIDNMFILTARAPQAQEAILEFMEGLGIELPEENVIGLGKSEGSAKAEWIANNLILAGYNELYFADDATQNVEAVSDMFKLFNVNGKVELANQDVIDTGESKFSEIIEEGEKDLSEDLNIIVEETTGTERQKEFSAAKAKERGKGKNRFKFFIPPSAEDFEGLIYSLLGKGEVGEKHHEWFKKHLFDPYSEGIRNLNIAQQTVANSAKQLKKQMPDAVKKAKQPVRGLKEYTYETAIRVYNWVKNGIEVPGLTKTDQDKLIKAVENDPDLLAYALATDVVMSQAGGYAKLEDNVGWLAGSIDGDMVRSLAQARESFLATWIENKNIIFSEANLNKIEAVYGAPYRKALEDSLWRMETGSHRSASTDDTTQRFMNWINGSIGTTMFFNARSALLQMLSSVNFINWEDNNMLKAGAAFANQPQYWADVNMIFHSDYLKQRRGGDEFDVNLADFANELSKAKNPMAVVIGKLIQLGYTPTKFADSLAIATGGATFYRNRVNTYVSQGMSKSKAEAQAFLDMQEIAETTQQSARPDKISQIQASPLGKIIFAFQNTPMQYARIIKKAVLDLVNGRGDAKSHISKIIYYGAIQNVIFYGLQTALFAFMFDDDEEENKDVAYARTLNGMVDSLLRGSGLPGAVIATAKNIVLEFFEQQDKAQPDHAYTVLEALNISPPVGIKARNMYNTLQTWEYNEDVANQMELTDFDNPLWSASTQAVQVATNLPTNKIYNKVKNVREAFNPDHETWKRIAMFLGWSSWSLGIESEEIAEAEAEIKEQKKEEKYLEKLFEEQAQIEENIEKQNEERKDDEVVKCAAVNKEGARCSNEALPGENFCTIHKPVPQQDNEVQCSHIKKDGTKCKMMTKNKSGKCYYHD